MIRNISNVPTFSINGNDVPLSFEITNQGRTSKCDLLSLTSDEKSSKLDWLHQDVGIIEQHYIKLSDGFYHVRINIVPMMSAMIKMKQVYQLDEELVSTSIKGSTILFNDNCGFMVYDSSSNKNDVFLSNNGVEVNYGTNASIVLSANKLFSINGLFYTGNLNLEEVKSLFETEITKEKKSCKS
jgi:hypothetical protein